jgi:hypothetical protein
MPPLNLDSAACRRGLGQARCLQAPTRRLAAGGLEVPPLAPRLAGGGRATATVPHVPFWVGLLHTSKSDAARSGTRRHTAPPPLRAGPGLPRLAVLGATEWAKSHSKKAA